MGSEVFVRIMESEEDSLPSGGDNHLLLNSYPLIPWKKKTYYCGCTVEFNAKLTRRIGLHR